ncbi:major facilitator superfamily domain-containing protein [Podospora aff. communis PSN243]|uniref:Major facilitator superfamily domain-containing protein n=1 Tax=Podospora aff. communis PSN243 TaxID=3040156 RepID=A0AAV9G084_9PEZI|nr:major facilitator superfamily domain-containing protein [Podospora aff. communis PSN243]
MDGKPQPQSSVRGNARQLVAWNGPDDLENPKNWPSGRKWRAVLAVSGFGLMSPLSTMIVAPAVAMILTIFMLGFAIGPLFISPISEIFGRTRVLQAFNLGFLAFNTACGGAQTGPQILACRFLAGLFGSSSWRGMLGDLFESHERGKAMAVYSLTPLIGPVLGPIMGGFLAQHVSWRWIFYATSILDALVQLWALFFLEETYTHAGAVGLYTEHDFEGSVMQVVRDSMVRPFKMLGTQIVIQVVSLYQGYLYGNIYILYSFFPTLWARRYGQPVDMASLNYLSLAIGLVLATEVTTQMNDRIYRHLSARNGNQGGRPEFRILLSVPATVLLAAGLFWYGWSAEKTLHWIMPNIGACIFSVGAYACTISNNTYIVDTYGHFSASGLAAIPMLRCLAGFAFPMFCPYICDALGYGITNSVLGGVAIACGLPAAIFLWRYGETLRRKSPYCAVHDA